MYRLREERPIEPKTLAHLVSSTLYEKRCVFLAFNINCRFSPYFISPIVAGVNSKTNEPYICGFDNIGYSPETLHPLILRCIDLSSSFIVAGTATDQLYGMLEALYEPDLGPDELFETMSQAFLNAVDRDAISGWGVVSYVMYVLSRSPLRVISCLIVERKIRLSRDI
jgi:20S proteasome subunit beta 3